MKIKKFHSLIIVFLISLCIKAQVAPTVTIISLTNINCVGIPVSFSANPSHSAVSYTWTVVPSKGLSNFSNLNTNTLSLTFTASTSYTISLSVTDTIGSSSSFTVIQVAKVPKASFNATLLDAGFPNQLVLINYSTNQLKNHWRFSDGAIDANLNTTKNYNASGSYSLILVAEGSKGCNDTAHYAFRISDSSGVTLPNIFSPNFDGVNDIYKPIIRGIYKLNATVYNRYGTIMASWDRVNGFWDGYTTSGQPCSVGEYFIVLEAFGFDDKKYKLKSSITLVR